jgi:hypothetical protein
VNRNLPLDPVRARYLELDELKALINVISWNRFEAACYLSGYALIDFDEFQTPPLGYFENLKKLLEEIATDPGLLQEFQKYKTKYRDIEETYNALGRLSKGRMKTVKVDDITGMIESAEPMVWIKLAIENNLWVAPGIEDAWINFLHRPKTRYLLPKFRSKKSIASESKKANSRKKQLNTRPLHESADIDNIQELGRKLFRENLDLSKQDIEEKIRKIYPRAECYKPIVIVRWLTWANIARRKKGGHTNLPNEV